ncbi:MAG: hypothetical protein E6I57_10300 [Chloroflexi bacterium]|nr:MAG: hypothetical protein E6I57_10300 [Chloroflexota bacterium]
MLGRALSRAIETQVVRETAYESSRLATRRPRRHASFAALAGAVAALGAVFGLALLATRIASGPVAGSPAPAVAPTPSPSASVTNGPPAIGVDHDVMYVARVGLPPVSFHIEMPVAFTVTREQRIAARITGLRALRADAVPPGTRNFLWNNTFQGGVNVTINGDLATVDLILLDRSWSVGEEGAEAGILQQLVYTATEEPGIRAVLFTRDGGQQMRIGQFVFSQPLTRENVFGYARVSPQLIGEDFVQACSPGPCPSVPIRLRSSYAVDSVAPGVTRFTIQVDSGQPSHFTIEPTVDSGQTTYQLALDDLRPWRVSTLRDPYRIQLDMGGYTSSISGSIAVYTPIPGAPPLPRFTVTGFTSAPEETVRWRLRDASQNVIASGVAPVGTHTGHQWAAFEFALPGAASATGDQWLEVYWQSAGDPLEQGLVRVRLKVG